MTPTGLEGDQEAPAAPGDQARLVRVFVASPADVRNERDAMSGVIDRINDTLGEERCARLILWRWERQAVPSLGEPQDLINPELDRADIVVVILWNRFGTVGAKGMTGTQEEVLRSVQRWGATQDRRPHVMIYRCCRPSNLDRDGTEQRLDLLKFLDTLPPSLMSNYEHVVDFERSVEQHLRKVMNILVPRHFTGRAASGPSIQIRVAELRSRIVERSLRTSLFTGSSSELAAGLGATIESLYVPLELGLKRDNGMPSAIRISAFAALSAKNGTKHFAIIGAPGSGKSTLLHYLEAQLAVGEQPAVPIFVPLREMVVTRGSAMEPSHIRAFLRRRIHLRTNDHTIDDYLMDNARFQSGELVILFDGLDELEREAAKAFLKALYELNEEFPETRTVVTGRPVGWQGHQIPDFYQMLDLLELGNEAIASYLRKRLGTEIDAARLVARTIDYNSRIAELARNPLLLSMICTSFEKIHSQDLITNRSDLYFECTRVLIERIYSRKEEPNPLLDYDETIAILKDVACRFFMWQEPDFPVEHVQLMASMVVPRSAVEGIVDMLDKVEQRCGLVQRSGDTYCFVHRSLWEYFTALAFIDKSVGALIHHAANPEWEEVVRLNVGLRARKGPSEAFDRLIRQLWIVNRPLCVRAGSEVGAATDIIRSLIAQHDENTERLLLVDSLDQSLELLPVSQRQRIADDTLRTLFVACDDRDCEVLYRAEQMLIRRGFAPLQPGGLIYDLLRLGEAPDRQARALEETESSLRWVRVEGGRGFVGHDKKGHDNERPKRQFEFAGFEMSKHPVTFHLARNFGWGLCPRPSGDRPNEWRKPLTHVTWYEAYYLAMWLDCRLPTEEQWEYAARGGQMALGHFKWFHGDDKDSLSKWAWFDEKGEQPHDVSEADESGNERNLNPLGLANMLGNTWEWTATTYRDGSHIEQSAEPSRRPIQVVKGERTMRGGTFKASADSVRCGRRVPTNPTNRGSTVGFRLVRGRDMGITGPEQIEVKE